MKSIRFQDFPLLLKKIEIEDFTVHFVGYFEGLKHWNNQSLPNFHLIDMMHLAIVGGLDIGSVQQFKIMVYINITDIDLEYIKLSHDCFIVL